MADEKQTSPALLIHGQYVWSLYAVTFRDIFILNLHKRPFRFIDLSCGFVYTGITLSLILEVKSWIFPNIWKA